VYELLHPETLPLDPQWDYEEAGALCSRVLYDDPDNWVAQGIMRILDGMSQRFPVWEHGRDGYTGQGWWEDWPWKDGRGYPLWEALKEEARLDNLPNAVDHIPTVGMVARWILAHPGYWNPNPDLYFDPVGECTYVRWPD
jgi:hypothetical protein